MTNKEMPSNRITMQEFMNKCESKTRDLKMACIQLNNECIETIKTDTPLYKDVMKKINN